MDVLVLVIMRVLAVRVVLVVLDVLIDVLQIAVIAPEVVMVLADGAVRTTVLQTAMADVLVLVLAVAEMFAVKTVHQAAKQVQAFNNYKIIKSRQLK